MSRIIEGISHFQTNSPEEIISAFFNIENRSVQDTLRNSYVNIVHNRIQYAIAVIHDFNESEQMDNLPHPAIDSEDATVSEPRHASEYGEKLLLKDAEGNLMAESQITLLASSKFPFIQSDEAYCHNILVRQGSEKKRDFQIMLKAQEVLARESEKKKIVINTRIMNTEDLLTLLQSGFRMVANPTIPTDSSFDEDMIRMEKDLTEEPLPFNPKGQRERILSQITPIIDEATQLPNLLNKAAIEIGVNATIENHTTLRELIRAVLNSGYIGIGILTHSDINVSHTGVTFVFQRKDSFPFTERLSFPIHAPGETGRLREVIMSNSPDAISMTHNLNSVAQANAQNLDTIAFKEEHANLVAMLEKQGVRVIRTSAFPKKSSDGKTALFTRDPAFVLDNTLVIGKLAKNERRYESDGMRKIATGHAVIDLDDQSEDSFIEGGDIIKLRDNTVIVGIGQRTNEKGFKQLTEAFPEYEFVGVKHTDLHLDVLFTVISSDKVLADTTRLPEEFLQWIKDMGYLVIPCDPHEQISLGCNVLTINDNTVIAVSENPITNERLRKNGVAVIEVSMPNVIKKGGGPRCLTCPTNRD